MKYHPLHIVFSLLIIVSFLSCSQTKKLQEIKKLQTNFIPKELPNIYIGMKLAELKENRGIQNISVIQNNFLTIVKEDYSKDSIAMIQYQFSKKNELYEIIIEYSSEIDAAEKYLEKYGPFNNKKEWMFTLNKKTKLKIWVYQNRLCIADSNHFNN